MPTPLTNHARRRRVKKETAAILKRLERLLNGHDLSPLEQGFVYAAVRLLATLLLLMKQPRRGSGR